MFNPSPDKANAALLTDEPRFSSQEFGEGLPTWEVQDSRALYRTDAWGSGYFDVNDRGHVCVTPEGSSAQQPEFDVKEIVDRLREEQGLTPPFVLRFPDILKSRMAELIDAFQAAIDRCHYQGTYQGCFPVKVNQQREVFEEVISYRHPKDGQAFGLEVGTKTELLAALAETPRPEAPIVCNGYKDAEMIDLALYGQKSGINVILVLERVEELELILQRSREVRIRPNLGIRVKVSSEGTGKWASTAGGKGLFGLNAYQMVVAVDTLRQHEMLDCLTMLHYHQGSQIPDLNAVSKGVEEVAAVYTELRAEGAAIDTINIGGGLAVDYDGSNIAGPNSKNYTLEQYAATIVTTLNDYAVANDVPSPNIISESGRAITTHYSVLVFEILRSETVESHEQSIENRDTECQPLLHLRELAENFPTDDLFGAGDRAADLLAECGLQFSDGRICLRELGEAQRLQTLIFHQVVAQSGSKWADARRLLDLARYADYYYGNFSIFQSIPDVWAIGQLFPIMPIHRLNEKPNRSGIIADITCDCDGRIKNYIDRRDESSAMPLHELNPREPYYIGVFLVGAYQEILGNFHNLMGRPTVATIRAGEDDQVNIETLPGDSAEWMLEHVHFDKKSLKRKISEQAFHAKGVGQLTTEECNEFIRIYERSLTGSSYLRYD